MTATATSSSINTADYVNPVIRSTREVFEMMLGCTPTRTGLMLKGENSPRHEVSAVIGVTGKIVGTIIFRVSERVACEVLHRLVGQTATSVNREVCDAVGELTNMIAGAAKAQLAHLKLAIGLPNIVSGSDHELHYPSNVKPFCILFDSELGPFMIEVGFAEQ